MILDEVVLMFMVGGVVEKVWLGEEVVVRGLFVLFWLNFVYV